MEGGQQQAKRRRIYSLEPNKVVQATFTRNYMNYLVPSLMKIKEKNSKEEKKIFDIHNVIKNEVDMAMVFSAQGFAWSNALKVKLQKGERVNENSSKEISQVKKNFEGEDDEDEVINGQLRNLRKLIPGGEEMCDEEMVKELESYISCLQMQVNILQCLTETS